MRLKRLDIYSFKSFADRTTIDFSDGITGIVGPNGCGKTNIIESIRWGLGEQNSRLIRAKKMDEVIFSGTKKRPPTSYCEVELTFEMKTETPSPLGFHELAFKRRIKRDGIGEYYINKTPCLLRDISDALLNIGITSRSYSLFSQDAIDRILDEDPRVRREMIEQVAGILKYQNQKSITLRRLDDTNADIQRLDDRIEEVGTALRRAKREARKALKYNELKNLYHQQLKIYAKTRKDQITQARKTLQDQIIELTQRRGEVVEKIQSIQKRLGELREQQHQINSQYTLATQNYREQAEFKNELDLEQERKRQKLENLEFKIEDLKQKIMEIDQLNPERNQKLADLNQNCTYLTEQLEINQKNLKDNQEKMDEYNYKTDNLNQTIDDFKQQIEKANADLINSEQRMAGAKEKRSLKVEQKPKLEQNIELRKIDLEELDHKLNDLQHSLENLEENEHKIQQNLEQKRKQNYKLNQNLDHLSQQIHAHSGEIKALNSEREILVNHQENLEGFEQSTKYLVQKYDLKVLGSSVKPETGYEVAVEAALRVAVNAVVTEEKSLNLFIQDLRQNDQSRSWFLITDGYSQVKPPEGIDQQWLLINHVNSDDENINIPLRKLLEKWLVAKTDEQFSEFKQNYPDYHVVNPDGDILYQGVLRSWGRTSGGVVGRSEKIDQLTGDIERLQQDKQQLIQDQKKNRENFSRQSAEIEEIEDQLKTLIDRKSTVQTEINNNRYHYKLLKENQQAEQQELAQINEDIENIDKIIAELNQQHSQLTVYLEKYNIQREEYENLKQGIVSEQQPLIDDINQQKVVIAGLEEKLRSTRERILEIEQNYQNLKEREQEYNHQLEQMQQQHCSGEQELAAVGEKVEISEQQLNQLSTEIENLGNQLEEIRTDQESLNDQLSGLQKEKDEISENLEQGNVKIAEYQGEINSIIGELKGTLGTDIKDLEQLEIPEQFDQQELDNLSRKLESYGPVNEAAEQEFVEIKQRYDFLNTQKNDLLDTQQGLQDSIDAIDRVATRKFLESFEQVRKNYREIFFDMFGYSDPAVNENVEADLMLEHQQDPLSSDIKVIAIPPGKKLKYTRSLSTGERTLTALCLLWALHQVRPSPLVVLDEFDAPLDDANVERFIRFIKRISSESQVIMVTHNRRTMEFCDTLYGVTMEEAGISTVVSVNLEKIDELLESDQPKAVQNQE